MSRDETQDDILPGATDGQRVMDNVSLGPCEIHVPLSWAEPAAATTVKVEPEAIWIEIAGDHAAPRAGDRVILEGPWNVRVLGTVSETQQGRVCVTVSRAVEKDRRAAQRSLGGLDVRYAIARDPGDAEAWMERGACAIERWFVPDPFMSFSSTGLRFDHRAVVEEGDLILLSFTVPHRSETWRGTARVVRVSDIPFAEQAEYMEGEPPASHRIAVHFESLPNEARDVLVARGLEILKAIRRL